jgi:hypothetical protein
MKGVPKNILIALGAACLLSQGQVHFGSKYIDKFLADNLVSLLIALLAINSASLGIVLSKIREIMDSSNAGASFERTKNAMLFSIKEQIVLIFGSLILLMINDSEWLLKHLDWRATIEIAVITCFTFAMLILYDSAKSIFVVLNFRKTEP